MQKFKTLAEAGEALRIAAEKEEKELDLQKQIQAGEITPSGKKILRFCNIRSSYRN